MKTPKFVVDTFTVLTQHIGKLKVDYDCDGTFHHYHWGDFYLYSGPKECRFSGYGIFTHYSSGYDLHPFALGIEKFFLAINKIKKLVKRIKKYLRFMLPFVPYMVKTRTKLNPEFFKGIWKWAGQS